MKTVAFSDLHGNYKVWKAIQNYYDKDDVLIFMGDACDRGPDGIKIMLELLQDDRVIYLKGNHEDMFLNNIHLGIGTALDTNKESIIFNGCYKTLKDYVKLPGDDKIFLIDNLQKIKNYYIYINKEKKNIFLSHAGIDIENINNLDETKLLWDRKHIKNNNYDNRYENWYVVHGHTPCQTLRKDMATRVYRYYNNHKIDIDIAACSTNLAAVIDLDTLEVKYFKGEDNNGN